MNFLNLYYFRVAAEELSFTNAAKHRCTRGTNEIK